jgi:hypothetical protein
MSALGQKQTLDWRPLMSALPPKADIEKTDWRPLMSALPPKADIEKTRQQNVAPENFLASLTTPQTRARSNKMTFAARLSPI